MRVTGVGGWGGSLVVYLSCVVFPSTRGRFWMPRRVAQLSYAFNPLEHFVNQNLPCVTTRFVCRGGVREGGCRLVRKLLDFSD